MREEGKGCKVSQEILDRTVSENFSLIASSFSFADLSSPSESSSPSLSPAGSKTETSPPPPAKTRIVELVLILKALKKSSSFGDEKEKKKELKKLEESFYKILKLDKHYHDKEEKKERQETEEKLLKMAKEKKKQVKLEELAPLRLILYNERPPNAESIKVEAASPEVKNSEIGQFDSPEEVSNCTFCSVKFSVFKGSVNCEACKKVFCKDCTSLQLALEPLGCLKEKEVCNNCFHSLTSIPLVPLDKKASCHVCKTSVKGSHHHDCKVCGKASCEECVVQLFLHLFLSPQDVCVECATQMTSVEFKTMRNAEHCTSCSNKFHGFHKKQKSRCNFCGSVKCEECTSNGLYLDNKHMRGSRPVCTQCFNELKNTFN